ncbi:MAG: HEAT repeat domain-containing protein [Acidobacteriaceae bacterium]
MSTRSSAANVRVCFLLLITGALLTVTNVSAQVQVAPLAPKWLAGTPTPPVETFADGLTRHHIPLTETALIAALANSDPEVRSLAAAQLAAMDDHQALPAIIDALEAESDIQVQVNLAGAATWLDSRRALEKLQQLCQNQNVPATARLDAARYVSNKDLPTCFSVVEQVEQSAQDADIRILALEAAVNYRGQADRAQALAISALGDLDPTVRIAAVEALQALHATGAVDTLARALPTEGDITVREHMREAIRALQHTDTPH